MVDFASFWHLYPRKIARSYAAKCWQRLSPEDQEAAFAALPAHLRYWQAHGTEWQYLPHASTWINGRRWEDELQMPELPRPRATLEEIARERGIEPRPGEEMEEFRRRVMQARH